MSVALVILILLIAVGAIWLSSQPAEYQVKRSRTIQASPDTLFSTISDLKSWPQWSPWLIHEPDAQMDYSDTPTDVDSWYTWNGRLIGAGKITHTALHAPNLIQQRIDFKKPMKSTSDTQFQIEEVDAEKTMVTWSMSGKMPFLFRWMSSKMDKWVGTDYEIGLIQLAQMVSDKEEPFKLSFTRQIETTDTHYIFAHYEGSTGAMPDTMKETFPVLLQAAIDAGLSPTDVPFTLYHRYDPDKDFASCDMCLPVNNQEQLSGYSSGALPGKKYFRTEMHGSYDFFPQAWYAAFSHIRFAKLKFDKTSPMVERYVTDPRESSGLGLISQIDLPLK